MMSSHNCTQYKVCPEDGIECIQLFRSEVLLVIHAFDMVTSLLASI